jgi:antitoxin component YwqK of YwqJK toxin-antitoxin module
VSLVALASVVALSACSGAPEERRVQAEYDKDTGKLRQLTVDITKDGKPNITSYMDGTKFLRIEIDANEDGKIERWEYYGADQRLERVGFSRSDDGTVDAWAFQGPDGSVSKVEVSTKRDGKVSRTEFYEQGALSRAEEDTDADGRVDKWEQYESGALVTVSFDTTKSGKPTTTIDYRK